jgi:hypothetical protein
MDEEPALHTSVLSAAEAIAALTRWQDFGGTWRVVALAGDSATLSLRRCDGGEEQERITGEGAELVNWLDGRTCDSDPSPGRTPD